MGKIWDVMKLLMTVSFGIVILMFGFFVGAGPGILISLVIVFVFFAFVISSENANRMEKHLKYLADAKKRGY